MKLAYCDNLLGLACTHLKEFWCEKIRGIARNL